MTTPERRGHRPDGLRDDQRTKQEVLQLLRRAGFPAETIRRVDEEFPEIIDLGRDANAFAQLGITYNLLSDWFGASP
jgi:hypothetical protein